MTYVTDIFLAQSWRDARLRLPSNMQEEYRILDVDWLHNIWRPDSFFKNAKKVTFHEMSIPNHYLWLYRDKTLLYMAKYERHFPVCSMRIRISTKFYRKIHVSCSFMVARLTLVLSCAMKFESYPHDTQVCSMLIESRKYESNAIMSLMTRSIEYI